MLNRRELLKLFGAVATVPAVLSQAISVEPVKPITKEELDWIPEADECIGEDLETDDSLDTDIGEPKVIDFPESGGGRIELKCSTITFKDSGSDREVTLGIGEGNITWSEQPRFDFMLERGCLDTVRLSDQQPLEVSIDMTYNYIKCDHEDWMSIVKAGQTTISLQCEDNGEIYNYQFDGFMWETMTWDLNCATFSIDGRCVPVL